ncbi:hypothetical protein OROMI_034502 [Orobanche minor]
MNRFPVKKNGNMGYQKSPSSSGGSFRKSGIFGGSGGFGGSKGFGGAGGSGGNGQDKKTTPLKEVNPMLDDISVRARCISIWHSHKLNAENDPYSFDIVLQDADNTRIQVYIKKEFMFRFEPLFEEGQCYIISNFGIAENGGKLPLVPHRFKISFYKTTIVTRIEPFDNNTHGFILEPFNHLGDPEHYQYYDNDSVDVIGSVVGIEKTIPVISAGGKKVRRTIVVEDAEANRLNLTFWDKWATMWDQYANKRDAIDHLVVILQLGKVKYWDGTAPVHNALFGSKIFVNRDIPEITEFKTRVQKRDGFQLDQLKIEVFSPEVKVQTMTEFFLGCVKRMVGGIRDCEPMSTIHRIHKESGWAYTACKECNKRVDVVEGRNRKSVFICEDHGSVQPVSRFKVILRLIDESGSSPVVFFNTQFSKLFGHTAWELMETHGMDPAEYWPQEVDNIIGKKCLFKIYYSEYNVNRNNHTYGCDGFSENVDFINHFKKDFLEDDVVDDFPDEVPNEDFSTRSTQEFSTPATLIKQVSISDPSLRRLLDFQSPPVSCQAPGSSSSFGSKKSRCLSPPPAAAELSGIAGKKQRVVVDLDNVESEPEDESVNGTQQAMVQVKIEPAD